MSSDHAATPDLENYGAFFIDMDGVIVLNNEPIDGSVECVRKLDQLGKVYILSNNSTKSRELFSDRLQSIGLEMSPEYVINSAYVLSRYLEEREGRQNVFTIGESGLEEELQKRGHRIVAPEQAEVLAVGMDRGLSYQKIQDGLTALLDDAKFYATNADKTFPTPTGKAPGAGASVGAIKGMGFNPEEIVGKPSKITAKVALEAAEIGDPRDVLMIGDRLETDILLAERAGMDSALLLSGVESQQSAARSSIEPTYMAENLSELLEL